MLKLVILSAGMTGRTHELKGDKTTIGRLDDNAIEIAEPSVSSHHCEVLVRGNEVLVRDLNSTNGTFVNGEKIAEAVLKPGGILRLGEIQMRLEGDAPPPSGKKHLDRTTVIPGGVSKSQLELGSGGGVLGDKTAGFSKKDNKVNKIFIVIGIVLGLIIIGLLVYISASIHH